MTHWYYALALTGSIAGMLTLDWRYKLVFWHDWRRAALTVLSAMVFFVLWDVAGIALGIFYGGDSPYTPALMLWRDFPPEELLFLFLLCHLTLVMYRGGARVYRHLCRS